MKTSLQYIPKQNFAVQSVNQELAGKSSQGSSFEEQAQKIGQELNENAKKIGSVIKEQAPTWKKGLDTFMNNVEDAVNTLVNKLQDMRR